ncbi:DHH family phosphoesterase [archaeon]|nr:DHH family phosphoesterase [archaeon]MBL7056840.1 DHH family phosphoesterase [Candidatus Woesearchaeota archaeon]
MAITDKEIKEIRKALDESVRPLFFFDDDPDGTCSFVQLYRYKGEGKGIILKAGSELREGFARKVEEYQPDLVVILDIPLVSQDFIDQVKQKIIWIDHHPPVKRKKIHYYNPRLHNDEDNRPTAYWAWKVAKKDLWIGMLGSVADWQLVDIKNEFAKKYPDYFDIKIQKPDDALFETKIGLLAKIVSFNLKGGVNDSMKSIKTFTRIEHPDEILKQTTPGGKYLYKKYESFNQEYKRLLNDAKPTKEKLLLYIYTYSNTAVTSDLSNELLHKFPDKFILVGRIKSEEVKMSIRSATTKVHPILMKALEEIDGFGGGHDFACGACVKERDFERFVEIIKEELKK